MLFFNRNKPATPPAPPPTRQAHANSMLKQLGYDSSPRSIGAFQKSQGLTQTQQVGPKTFGALQFATHSVPKAIPVRDETRVDPNLRVQGEKRAPWFSRNRNAPQAPGTTPARDLQRTDAAQRTHGQIDGVTPMSQLAYPDIKTGHSKTNSIADTGCMLTSMAMTSSKLNGDKNLNPALANERVKAGGGFSGGGINDQAAARALGMRMTERSAVSDANSASMNRRLDQALGANRPVVAGVDFRAGNSSGRSNADHFITMTSKNADGSYNAIDPLGGGRIKLALGKDGKLHDTGGRNYTVAEMMFLQKR